MAAIETRQLSKNYGAISALSDVTMTVDPGEFVALIGENGAGKTSLLSILMGLREASSGTVLIGNDKPGDIRARARTGAMLQSTELPSTLKVRELLELFASYYQNPRDIEELLSLTDLKGLQDRRYKALSGGQQRRVQLAVSIVGNPEILFLDEPTVGLDMDMRREFWQLLSGLKKSGVTVILTSHYLDEIDALADRLIIIRGGRIIADGQTSDIKKRVEHKNIVCDTNLSIDEIKGIDGVEMVTSNGRLVTISTRHENTVLRTLLTRDPRLKDLMVSASNLEDAITRITGPVVENVR